MAVYPYWRPEYPEEGHDRPTGVRIPWGRLGSDETLVKQRFNTVLSDTSGSCPIQVDPVS